MSGRAGGSYPCEIRMSYTDFISNAKVTYKKNLLTFSLDIALINGFSIITKALIILIKISH